MASSASDAGHSEKLIREKLVKTGAVDIMVSISNNFFYTRSLPCTLWFYDRAKEKDKKRKDKILMLDARKVYRKVSTTINDFSPEQLENLTAIVKLYRGDRGYFAKVLEKRLRLVKDELRKFHGHLKDEVVQVNTAAIRIQSLATSIALSDKSIAKAYRTGIVDLCTIGEDIAGCLNQLQSNLARGDGRLAASLEHPQRFDHSIAALGRNGALTSEGCVGGILGVQIIVLAAPTTIAFIRRRDLEHRPRGGSEFR